MFSLHLTWAHRCLEPAQRASLIAHPAAILFSPPPPPLVSHLPRHQGKKKKRLPPPPPSPFFLDKKNNSSPPFHRTERERDRCLKSLLKFGEPANNNDGVCFFFFFLLFAKLAFFLSSVFLRGKNRDFWPSGSQIPPPILHTSGEVTRFWKLRPDQKTPLLLNHLIWLDFKTCS